MPGPAHAESPKAPSSYDKLCSKVPNLVSAFVDTFVDFTVGGQFLGDSLSRPVSSCSSAQVNNKAGDLADANKAADDGGFGAGNRSFVTRHPAVERLVAIGDVHGDLSKTRESLRIAGVINKEDKWSGGKTVVVQVGDLLDRGNEELKVIYLLERLKREAQREGGDIYIMNGNHEIMNIEGRFLYATKEGLDEFRTWGQWYKMGQVLKERCDGLEKQPDVFKNINKGIPEGLRSRFAALRPGGPISARFLAHHPTVLVVGSTVFAHGGILPAHVKYGLDNINAEVRDWIQGGKGRWAPDFLQGRDAVVWARMYSIPSEALCNCKLLDDALGAIAGADRMVVGHTIQAPWGINGACKNRVIRVDVGMSRGCENAAPEVLEIRRDSDIHVLTTHASKKLQEKVSPGLASLLVKDVSRVHGSP